MVEDHEDLSDEEIQQLYPDLEMEGGEEDSEDDWEQQFDWTIHDSDIQDFFQPEWSETDMLEQQDFVSFLQILGLEGEEAEGIKYVSCLLLSLVFCPTLTEMGGKKKKKIGGSQTISVR